MSACVRMHSLSLPVHVQSWGFGTIKETWESLVAAQYKVKNTVVKMLRVCACTAAEQRACTCFAFNDWCGCFKASGNSTVPTIISHCLRFLQDNVLLSTGGGAELIRRSPPELIRIQSSAQGHIRRVDNCHFGGLNSVPPLEWCCLSLSYRYVVRSKLRR